MRDRGKTREALIEELEQLRAEVSDLRRTIRDYDEARDAPSRALRELRLAKRRAEEATRAKSEFLANMSHELRTPMTAILGYTQLVIEEGDISRAPGRRLEQLKTIERNGEHLLHILTDILDLSKIEAGKMEIEKIPTSAFELLNDIESVMQNSAREKNIGFEVQYASPIPELIETDPTRLRQILMNLVGNAIKFTERGGVRVVTQIVEEGDSPKLRVAVSDTGPGLAPEARERIFGSFSQADASTTRKYGGTGLGLTISLQLARLMGGNIEVDSLEGHGCTFVLTVDAGSVEGVDTVDTPSSYSRPSAADEFDAEESSRRLLENLYESSSEARILLVEDGEDNRRLVSTMLEKAGFEVAQAENGEVGVELALEARAMDTPFDLILMDMQMPVMDGYDATRRLREEGYSSPIVALTAHAMKGDRQRCVDAGCDDFLTKPIDRRQLVTTILERISKSEDCE